MDYATVAIMTVLTAIVVTIVEIMPGGITIMIEGRMTAVVNGGIAMIHISMNVSDTLITMIAHIVNRLEP